MASLGLHHLLSLLYWLILLLLPTILAQQFECQINLGSSISEANGRPPWKSPSGDFAFGLRKVQEGNKTAFLLAIWFDKVDDKTIVWSAKSSLAPGGSEVRLTDKGELTLYDPKQGKELWKAPTTGGDKSTCAAMQNNGNFVLLNKDRSPIWQTFKEPTDTILPGQVLDRPSNLTARMSPDNYADGRFRLTLQTDGNLVLYAVSTLTGVIHGSYWATGTMHAKSQLLFNKTGFIYISDGGKRIFNLTTKEPGSENDFYHLARLDYDGAFRQYQHPKGGTCNSNWTEVERIPQDICAITINIGSGACGFNSYCAEINDQVSCLCPDSYSYLNPNDTHGGCKPDFSFPRCQTNGQKTQQDLADFVEYENTDWPLSDYDLQIGDGVDKKTCKKLCQDDCFCVAAIFNGNRCWKKKYPLSNGRKSQGVNRTALLKVFPPNAEVLDKKDLDKKDHTTLVIVGSILLGSSVFLNIIMLLSILGAFIYLYRKKLLQSTSGVLTTNLKCYTYKELEEATSGFKQVLGKGAFGTVFKGVLLSTTKRYVAVKKLDRVVEDGEKEFKTEVSVIGQTHHKNLVRLLGYCDEGENRLLVYEYMSNGSLASFLFGITRPDWNQRTQIAFGIARGLMYLHEECSTQIIHCDIKPQNILLDEYFTPRISDFGLAKLMLAEQSRVARTAIRGTIGYFAPEWFRKASITSKVDVYSFGAMLLELICCKSSVSFGIEREEEALMEHVYDCYKQKKLDTLVENDEEAKNDLRRVERLVMISIWCIQEDPALRPSMKRITQMLEGVIEVSVPPCPWNINISSTASYL